MSRFKVPPRALGAERSDAPNAPFSPSWYFLLATRFMVGLFIGGSLGTMYTLINELILPSHRTILRGLFNWGFARFLITLLCMFLPNWTSASIALAAAILPTLFSIIFIIPESPTWLHNKNRLDKMVASEKRMSWVAGIPFTEPVHKPSPSKGKGFLDLIREPLLLKRILVLWLMWFCSAISSYFIDLNSSSISGNFYLNQFCLSLMLGFSKTILFLNPHFLDLTRRKLHQGAQTVVISCFTALTIMTIIGYQGIFVLITSMIGITFIEFTWDACYLCAAESVPTALRTSLIGSCSVFARFGAIFAPSLIMLNSFWAPAAYSIMVLLATLNLLISYFFLIETKGIDLDAVQVTRHQPVEIMLELVIDGDQQKEEEMDRLLVMDGDKPRDADARREVRHG